MKTYCNPLDLGYRYQHMKEGERIAGFREGADPTLVYFKGKYYLFVSMSAGFWYSDDLLHWDFHADPPTPPPRGHLPSKGRLFSLHLFIKSIKI